MTQDEQRTGLPQAELAAAVRASFIAFAANGFAFASWASRIPQVKQSLGLDPAGLGLVLLAIAAGSIIGLPLSGPAVARFGSRRSVEAMAILAGLGLVLVAVGYRVGTAPVVVGLFVYGAATGGWDVAMNVQGAAVERALGRAIMSRFHAGFSLGTVAGALGGAAMVALGVQVTVHLLVVGVAVPSMVALAVRRFVSDRGDRDESVGARRGSLSAWREPRTLLIGVFVLAFAFAEGTGNDWISVSTIDDRHLAPAVATLAFAAFIAAMTAGRWVGPWLLEGYGRVAVLRGLIGTAVAGLLVFVFGPGPFAVFAGAMLWGAGVSLGFPVGMSAGADEPALAAARVSVISSIGYCAFLAGPPLIGFLAQRDNVLHALTSVIALLVLAGITTSAVRPPGERVNRATRGP